MRTSYRNITVSGLNVLQNRMAALEPKIAKRYGYRATAKGAVVIRDEARRQAVFTHGYSTGLVKKNIIQFRPKRRKKGACEVDVGVRIRNISGSREKRREAGRLLRRKQLKKRALARIDAYYWHMVEFGTAKQAAQPFLRPAFEMKKYEAVLVIRDELGKSLDAMAK